ncbi:hypothetical protein [Paenibacillus campi]|uniref:hypothetical protein n=1 Tax=Paenibacillus campi TaxID=3106031 RepID=UPI002AFE02F7|nr:hypothetical protein [Paenibacillus sp. SGZ-1014]
MSFPKKIKIPILLLFVFTVLVFFTSNAIKIYASEAISVTDSVYSDTVYPNAVTPDYNVARLTIFADGGSNTTGSSGSGNITDFGVHAFVTIKNSNTSAIQVGGLTGIVPGKTVSVGTWGNKSEHNGVWYNLEEKFIANQDAYKSRVSLTIDLSSGQLQAVNNYIKNHDDWGYTNNCSSFAVGIWNTVAATTLSAGTINTPKNLANSIKSKSGYISGMAVPNDYLVYYANGANAPIRSRSF